MSACIRMACAALGLVACLGALLAACTTAQHDVPSRDSERVAMSAQVEVDGARLHLEVHGDHADDPLLLWLHGGPGGAERPLFRYFNGDLERRLLVAYYDQRGAGRSFDAEASTALLTIAQHLADLDHVVDQLRSQYRRERVLLVGHSWGAALGMLYAKAHPDKVWGLICVAPVVSISEQQRREYAFDLGEATRRGDRHALEVLREIGPPPYASPGPMIRLQRVTGRYRGVAFMPRNHAAIVLAGILQGLVTPPEVVRIVRGMHRSLQAMHRELLAFDMRREVTALDVPVFFFLGRHDRHVDADLAAEYFAALTAPTKKLVWFADSAHDIPFDEPAAFNQRVMEAFAEIDGTRSCVTADRRPPSSPKPVSKSELCP